MTNQHMDAFFSADGDLRVLTACPFCNTSYTRAARVLAQKDDAHVVHIECRNCGGSIVALILPGAVGMQSVGVVTDLLRDEVATFFSALPVASDDVLNIHALLSEESSPELLLSRKH